MMSVAMVTPGTLQGRQGYKYMYMCIHVDTCMYMYMYIIVECEKYTCNVSNNGMIGMKQTLSLRHVDIMLGGGGGGHLINVMSTNNTTDIKSGRTRLQLA